MDKMTLKQWGAAGDEIKRLSDLNSKLLIALKSQHQPHMDYVFEIDMTVTELIKEIENEY